MGKKKRAQVFVLKPWCWYCEREFEDDKVLLQHQKSKHFKCQLCPRKLNTAGGLMVHSQQVHKCEPEPLTNTLPGRDGYDIEIFGMEGVPTNALAEWKAKKEEEMGTSAFGAGAAGKRPRHAYAIIAEADLQAALSQHKALMAARSQPVVNIPFPQGFPPPSFGGPGMPAFPPPGIGMPPPTLPQGMPPFAMPPPNFRPPFLAPPPPGSTPFDGSPVNLPIASPSGLPVTLPTAVQPPAAISSNITVSPGPGALVLPPKDGVVWPDISASPAEKRSLQARYRYTSPTPAEEESDGASGLKKRKAAVDFL